MDLFLVIINVVVGVVVLLFVAGFIIFSIRKKAGGGDQSMLLIQNQMSEVRRTLDSKLSEYEKIIRDITKGLTKVDEGQKRVVDIAKQLDSLQDILKNPKQRGVLGEYYLETVLKNVMPPGTYQMQYAFKDGVIVDAAVFVKDKIIPIDSKFSLENYNRLLQASDNAERKRLEDALRNDLKARIDETSKYIKPEEGTTEFAFMFIPSEAVYYDLLVNKVGSITARDLIEYAMVDKRVIIVSPTSFLAYLQTVLQGLKALQIEESAKEIRKQVEMLGRHLGGYETYMSKMGGHLKTTVNSYNTAYKELGKIDKDVTKISGEAVGIEPSVIEGPSMEDEDE